MINGLLKRAPKLFHSLVNKEETLQNALSAVQKTLQ